MANCWTTWLIRVKRRAGKMTVESKMKEVSLLWHETVLEPALSGIFSSSLAKSFEIPIRGGRKPQKVGEGEWGTGAWVTSFTEKIGNKKGHLMYVWA